MEEINPWTGWRLYALPLCSNYLMNFIRRRSILLTRNEVLGYISEAALEGGHEKASGLAFPRVTGEGAELRAQTHQVCEEASRLFTTNPADQAVARGVLAQQAALEQAVQLLERQLNRTLTEGEKGRILQNLAKVLDLSPDPTSLLRPIRGPRSSREAWGH